MKATKTELLEELQGEVKNSKDTIDKFITSLQTAPASAFEWGADAIKAACKVEIYSYVIEVINSTNNAHTANAIEKLKATLNDSIFRAALWPKHSTSQISNLTDVYRNVARAEALGFLEKLELKEEK